MDQTEWQAFGEWIESLRKRSGLQVRELAEQTGVSAQWLQEIRHGGRAVYGTWRLPNPKDEALARLARALNVPVEEVFARARRETPLRWDDKEELAASPDDAARLRKLEERVEQQARDLAELRRRLEEREERAGGR
jgi:transcriptional regulator with XRE-family HTH domain